MTCFRLPLAHRKNIEVDHPPRNHADKGGLRHLLAYDLHAMNTCLHRLSRRHFVADHPRGDPFDGPIARVYRHIFE
jgi:hypothetical protein